MHAICRNVQWWWRMTKLENSSPDLSSSAGCIQLCTARGSAALLSSRDAQHVLVDGGVAVGIPTIVGIPTAVAV